NDQELGSAFERESRLLASLYHPALPTVTSHFVEDGVQYLIMEFIPGEDLAQMLKRTGAPFPLIRIIEWAFQLLDVMEYLHSQRPPVIHRDIKPHNLKLNKQGQIVLLDFGLAKGEPKLFESASASSVFGFTINYAPLEQIEHKGTDARSDIYSAGATLYQLMTARIPAGSLSRAAAIVSGERDPLIPINLVNPIVPDALANVVAKSTALKIDDRYHTAAAMKLALRESLSAPPVHQWTRVPVQLPTPPDAPRLVFDASGRTSPVRGMHAAHTQLIVGPARSAALEPKASHTPATTSESALTAQTDPHPRDPMTKRVSAAVAFTFSVFCLFLLIMRPSSSPPPMGPTTASGPPAAEAPTNNTPSIPFDPFLPAPKLITSGPNRPSLHDGSVTLHWNAAKGAVKYRVIVSNESLTDARLVGETSGLIIRLPVPGDARKVMLAAVYPTGQVSTSKLYTIEK
ncbi:MAG TPA: serine/threonine-protein kinase, partial [Blastocatellia bacterium]|nr:serine/threonine-protein kinase [Blastocatellia bacterium]